MSYIYFEVVEVKKRIGVISLLVACLVFVSYIYLKPSAKEPDKKDKDATLKTVVFKDRDDELIPISIDFYSSVELEKDVRNRIDLMKSHEFEDYGLYPVLNEHLTVQSVELDKGILTIDFNDELYSNADALDIIETLTYTMTDYADVQQLKLQIDGKNITNLPNSYIPVTSLTGNLGLNNFEDASHFLHQTIPVMVYAKKDIQQYSYYVPTTMRIDETVSLKKQVQTILKYIDSKIHLIDAKLENEVLTLELDSNILLDNERIDQTLEDLIVLSLCTLPNVKDVEIQINNEDVRTKTSSQIQYNYLKI